MIKAYWILAIITMSLILISAIINLAYQIGERIKIKKGRKNIKKALEELSKELKETLKEDKE